MNFLLKSCLKLLFFICLIFSNSVSCDDSNNKNPNTKNCNNELDRKDVEFYLSTKTPYRVVANYNETVNNYKGCRPTRMWSIIRHGARNPSKKIIEQAKIVLTSVKEQILSNPKVNLCSKHREQLQKWHFHVNSTEEKYLVAEGEDELIELAERMQNRLPDLLAKDYNPELYYFKYTATQRTLKSAQSFATGLFGRNRINQIIYPEALHKDPVLRFYKLCNRWKIDVDKNPQTFDNVHKFLEGEIMQNAIKQVSKTTQIEDIDAATVRLIYTICAFETAWHGRWQTEPSAWCQFLSAETIKVLEFIEDLEYYWNDGYGYELTHRIACPAMANMFQHIDPQSKLPNSTFYFTHSGTMLKLLAHLGLYKDLQPLTFKDYAKHRMWRTSLIDAFASNVAFVLYDCNNAGPMILVMHQEKVIRIPGCPKQQDLCSLQTMLQLFSNSLNNCNFAEMCFKES